MSDKNRIQMNQIKTESCVSWYVTDLMPRNAMLVLCSLVLFTTLFAIGPVGGQEASSFGYQLLPEKVLENTEVTLQIYALSGETMVPKNIDNLSAISSDSEVIQVLGIEQTQHYMTNLKIKTVKAGTANIVIAAPGFDSQEIPITVHTNNNNPSQLLLKMTPDDFAVDSPKFGYVAVELLTSGGLPTKASNDTTVTLLSPQSDVLELVEDKLIIPKGIHYAIGQFKVKDPGDAIVFAETPGMPKVSAKVHVREATKPLTLRLYTYPSQYLSLTNNIGYAIVQLEDGEGIPVKAMRDIPVNIAVDNPEATVNTSTDTEEIAFSEGTLVIKEGTYSAYTSFLPRPDFSDLTDSGSESSGSSSESVSKTFNIQISSEGYVTEGSSITVIHDSGVGELNGNGPALIGMVPFLATGGKEVLGVAYLETQIETAKQDSTGASSIAEITVPVMSKGKFVMKTTSSDLKAVSVIDPVFETGKNAALVFGNTGTVIPDDPVILTYEDNEGIKVSTAIPQGPVKDDLALTAKSLIDEILVGEEFPVLAFMTVSSGEGDSSESTTTGDGEAESEDGREGPTRFVSDAVIVFEANDLVDVTPQSIKQNQPYLLFNAKADDVGTTTISGTSGEFDVDLSITSKTADPTNVHVSHVGTALPAIENLATIQLLDSAENPVFVKKDTEIKLVSSGNNIVEIPNSVVIKAGEYFTTFTIKGVAEGEAEISTLSENLPLQKFLVEIKSLQPTLTLTAPDAVYPGDDFTGDLSLAFSETGIPTSNYSIQWNVQGAEIIRMDDATSDGGTAKIVLKAIDPQTITITATISGSGVSSVVATKQVTVNAPIVPIVEEKPDTGMLGITVSGIDIVYLIIPAAAGGVIFFLKKTGRLEGILEKIRIGGLIDTIKDKILSRN